MFAVRLDQAPPGLFIFGDCLGFKTEYRTNEGRVEAYVVASGEFFAGGTSTVAERNALMVTPVEIADQSALRLARFETDE